MNDRASTTRKTVIVGVGVMGETLLTGLLNAGWERDSLLMADRRTERGNELERKHSVHFAGNAEAAAVAETLVLVVKPQDVGDVLDEIAPHLAADTLVVSLCAGISTDLIEARLHRPTPVVRVMPNTPAQVGEGMAAVSAGAHADQSHLNRATTMMAAVGRVVTVPEKYQDAVTAISGSGPAYLFFVVEAMIEAGVHLGLPRATATELVVQTMLGSATLLRDSHEHPTILRENVTSPGGTTAAAIRELEDHKVRAAFITAIEAARDRSVALSDALRASS